MKNPSPRQSLNERRDQLAKRWLNRFADNRAESFRVPVEVPADLVFALFDEVMLLLATSRPTVVPRRHCATALARLADFPQSVAVCIDLMQAGAQVLGAFVVENAGPNAAWDTSDRNKLLGELDAVFHILVHREIQALCETCLHPELVATLSEVCDLSSPLFDLGDTPTETFNSN
jgi:hypothetical protein